MATRREFLGWASAALGSSTVSASPIDPFKRTGRPVFKLSLAAYSMRQFLAAKPESERKMDMLQFVDYAASLGLQGVEPTSYYFDREVAPGIFRRFKHRAHLRGLDLSAGAIRNDFCQRSGPELDADLKHCEQWIDLYAKMGVRAIRIFAGSTPKGEEEKEAVKRCIGVLERACDPAEKAGVFLALENHGGVTSHVDTMLEIVKAVQSRWFGVNLDSGNFKESADPYADLARIAPYAVNAQIKIEITRKVDGKAKTEETDYRKVIQLLKDAGYTGWIALEYEGKEDPYAGVPKALDKLRSALAAEGMLSS